MLLSNKNYKRETVAHELRPHCGEDWMVRAGFGLEEPDREKRLESVIRFWLKDALAVEQKSSRKKKGGCCSRRSTAIGAPARAG